MVTLACLLGDGGTSKVKMPPMRLLDVFSNKELLDVAYHSKLKTGTVAAEVSSSDPGASKSREQLTAACKQEHAALRLPPSLPKSWEEKNIQRVADAVVLRKAGSSILAHAIAHTSIRPTHPVKKIGSPRLSAMPPPSGPPAPPSVVSERLRLESESHHTDCSSSSCCRCSYCVC